MAKERFNKKGKKKEYKTDTIMQRAIMVYLPTIEMKRKWQDLAKKSGLSISRFVIEKVENSLAEDKKEIHGSVVELTQEIKELKDENAKLRKRNEMLDKIIERLEEELRMWRNRPFMDEEFEGVRRYEQKLVELLKEKIWLRKGDELELLGINPMKEPDIVKAINKQLENLERYGLIESVGRRWKWKG